MPNEKNAAALAALLTEYIIGKDGSGLNYIDVSHSSFHGERHRAHETESYFGDVARFLAERGVLVSSALTDEEAERLRNCPDPDWPSSGHGRAVDGAQIRAGLERIAKG